MSLNQIERLRSQLDSNPNRPIARAIALTTVLLRLAQYLILVPCMQWNRCYQYLSSLLISSLPSIYLVKNFILKKWTFKTTSLNYLQINGAFTNSIICENFKTIFVKFRRWQNHKTFLNVTLLWPKFKTLYYKQLSWFTNNF